MCIKKIQKHCNKLLLILNALMYWLGKSQTKQIRGGWNSRVDLAERLWLRALVITSGLVFPCNYHVLPWNAFELDIWGTVQVIETGRVTYIVLWENIPISSKGDLCSIQWIYFWCLSKQEAEQNKQEIWDPLHWCGEQLAETATLLLFLTPWTYVYMSCRTLMCRDIFKDKTKTNQ